MTKRYTVRLSEMFFYIYFFCLLFAKGIGLYDGQTLFKFFLLIALVAWVGKMIFTKYSVKEMVLYCCILLLAGLIYIVTREKGVLFTFLLICALKNMEISKVFKVGLLSWSISFGTIFLITSFHVIDSGFKVHDRLGMGRVIRWNLGYAHPNVLHISFLTLICLIVFIIQNKLSWYHLILMELANIYVFMYSLSTTGFLVSTLFLALAYYWILRKSLSKVEQVLVQFCLPTCLFLSYGAPLLLKGRVFEITNRILNTRLELSKWFLENQPVQPLGVNTAQIVTNLRTMDNSYVFALITYGYIFVAVIAFLYLRIIYRKTKQQDGIALCIIISCLIAGLTEPFLFNTSFKNLSLLFIGTELWADKPALQKIGLNIDKKIEFTALDMELILRQGKGIKRITKTRLAVMAIVCATVVGVLAFNTTSMPERYLLPRKDFENTNDLIQDYYLESDNDIQRSGDKILGYQGKEVPMVAFSGNIARLERIRNTIAGSMLTGILIYLTGIFVISMKERNARK